MRTPGITGLPDPLAAGLALGGLPGLAGCFVIPLDQFNGADRATVEAGITVFRGLLRCARNILYKLSQWLRYYPVFFCSYIRGRIPTSLFAGFQISV